MKIRVRFDAFDLREALTDAAAESMPRDVRDGDFAAEMMETREDRYREALSPWIDISSEGSPAGAALDGVRALARSARRKLNSLDPAGEWRAGAEMILQDFDRFLAEGFAGGGRITVEFDTEAGTARVSRRDGKEEVGRLGAKLRLEALLEEVDENVDLLDPEMVKVWRAWAKRTLAELEDEPEGAAPVGALVDKSAAYALALENEPERQVYPERKPLHEEIKSPDLDEPEGGAA